MIGVKVRVKRAYSPLVGKEAKGDGVEHLENRYGPDRRGVILKGRSFPIIVLPDVTTGCEENRERRF